MSAAVFSGLIFGFCALLMFGIGIWQFRSRKPVGFYSGEKPPDEKELTDVRAWNKKHGMMWMLYGGLIVLAGVCGIVMGSSVLLLIPFLVCPLLPLPFMVWYHHHLIRKYSVKNDSVYKRCSP